MLNEKGGKTLISNPQGRRERERDRERERETRGTIYPLRF